MLIGERKRHKRGNALQLNGPRPRMNTPYEPVDLAVGLSVLVPSAGFDLVEGLTLRHPLAQRRAPYVFDGQTETLPGPVTDGNQGTMHKDYFLVSRIPTGELKRVTIPPDLYLDFRRLKHEQIQDFAKTYGTLRRIGEHFHRTPDAVPYSGESISFWTRELDCFRDVWDLWDAIKQKEGPGRVSHRLELLRAPWPIKAGAGETDPRPASAEEEPIAGFKFP